MNPSIEPLEAQAPVETETVDAPTSIEAPAAVPAKTPSNAPARHIALLNQKGGVGKTTSTVNLGAALAAMGQRVLLIDLDPQAHLSLHLGLDPDALEHTVYDLLTCDDVSAFEVVQQINDQLAVLPSQVNLAGVEAELAADMMTGRAQRLLKDQCEPLLADRHFDFVLIDCPPSLGLLTINALTLANEVIVPMQAHFLALQGLSKLFETVQLVSQGFNPQLQVTGVLLCMHEGQTLLANEIQNDLNAFLESARGTTAPWRNAIVHQPPIRRNIKLAESPSFGKSIFDYAPDCHGAGDYRKLAESLCAQMVRA